MRINTQASRWYLLSVVGQTLPTCRVAGLSLSAEGGSPAAGTNSPKAHAAQRGLPPVEGSSPQVLTQKSWVKYLQGAKRSHLTDPHLVARGIIRK